jgi:ketosteroid isomerase-like protein
MRVATGCDGAVSVRGRECDMGFARLRRAREYREGGVNIRWTILFLALGMLPVLAAGREAPGTAVSDISEQWAGYWNAKNLGAIMTLYGPEPMFLPTTGHGWQGAAEIRKNFAGLLANYDPRINLHSVRSEVSGNLAYDSGTYDEVVAPVKGGKAIHASGNYLFLFKRAKGGRWKILEQTWTEFEPVKL